MGYERSAHKQAANLEKNVQTPNKIGYLCLDIEKEYARTRKNSHIRLQEYLSSGT